MNKLLIISALSIFMFSCQEGVDKLKAEKTKLEKEYKSLGEKIADLDTKIAAFDTVTVKKYVLVTTTPVVQSSFAHYFEVQGTIEADKNVILYPEMGGVIRHIRVSRGDRVRKGQVLIDLDTEIIELQIKELQTSLDLATTTFERQQRLWDQKIGSEMQYLQTKNQKESLETKIASLKAQLRKNRIVAPFSGVVDEIWPKEGELTSQMTQMVRLVNLDKVYIIADVSESYIGKVDKGTDVQIYFPAFDQTIKGKVDVVGSFINPLNRTFKIQVNLPNTEQNIKPNLMAYVKVKDFAVDTGLVVPNHLIQENPQGGKFVYLSNKASGIANVRKVAVSTQISYNNHTLVTSGIKASDILVNKGARSIKDGQTVQVVK